MKKDVKFFDKKLDKVLLGNKEQFDKYIENSLYKIYLKNNINSDENKQNIYKTLFKEDFELNSLYYKEAIKLVQRIYCQYYLSLLKYNHPILFSFGFYNDYNSKIIFFYVSTCQLMLYFLLMILCIRYIKIKENLIFYIKYLKYYIQH